MKIEKKIEKVVKQQVLNSNINHYDDIYKKSSKETRESNLPTLENRHKSDELKNLKFITNNK